MSETRYSTRIQLLAYMVLGHFVHHINLYAFPALIIFISRDLNLSYLEMGLLGTAPVLIMAVTSPLVGHAGKNATWGFWLVISGIMAFAIASSMFTISTSFWELFIGNLILGLGATTYHPIGLGVSANSFPTERRSISMSINHAAGVLGTAVSPILVLGATIFFFDSWRETYIFLAIINLVVVILLVAWLLIEKLDLEYRHILESEHEKNIDKINDLVRNKGLNTTRDNANEFKNWLVMILALVILLSMFRGGIYRSFSYFIVALFRDFYGFTPLDAGLVTSFILLIGSISDIYGATESDKRGTIGRIKLISISSFLTSIVILAVAWITTKFSEWWIIFISFSIFAIVFYLAGGTLQALMSDVVPPKHRTFFYSIIFSVGLIISSVSPTIFGWLLDLFQDPSGALVFIALLGMTSFGISLLVFKKLKEGKEKDFLFK